jgi:hypothetical protein
MEDSRRIFQPSDTVNIFEDLYLRSLVSNRFLKIPKYSLELLLSLFPSLEEWTKRRYYFPGYMLDFISLGMILEDYPGISFIGHGPLFWKNISEYEIDNYEKYPTGAIQKEGSLSRCLRKYHNLYADISGDSGFRALDRDHGFAREFLSEFEQKVIFGTDNTDIGHEYLVNTLGLSKSVINKIMGENAFKLIQP